MPSVMMATGGIYAFRYRYPKTDFRMPIVAIILHAGLTKVHALSLSTPNLPISGRLKLVNIIRRLSAVDASSKYSGRILYRIFRKYAPNEIRLCYRTYHTMGVFKYSLVNYGLNPKDSLTDMEKKMLFSRESYMQAKKRYVTRLINQFTKKGFEGYDVDQLFVKPRPEDITQPDSTVEENRDNVRDSSYDDYLGE